MMMEIRWHGRGGQGADFFEDTPGKLLAAIVFLSFSLRFAMIFKYGNLLTLASDDLNYIQSAVLLLDKGIFTFFNKVEPTVFVMPLYPLFLSGVFSVMGSGIAGLTVVRLIQSIFGAIDIIMVFAIASRLFNRYVAVIAAAVIAFYLPAIVTSGYFLTENLFTTLFLLMIHLSYKYAETMRPYQFAILGVIWTAAVMTRPTVAFYPAVFFAFIFMNRKRFPGGTPSLSVPQAAHPMSVTPGKAVSALGIGNILRCGISMAIVSIVIMLPWWYRNYTEYGAFIPLSAASGNPLLQGTYIGYEQEPGQTASYSNGKTTYERNRNEVAAAKKRMATVFREDFRRYLHWYTVGKTALLWGTVFYWREFFNIGWNYVLIHHRLIIFGFLGLLVCLVKDFRRFFLPFAVIAVFNLIYCIYMAFDRYAYPLLPILAIFFAFLAYEAAKPFILFLKPIVINILTTKRMAYKSK